MSVAVALLLMLVSVVAMAQDATVSSAASDHAVDYALNWVCTNQSLVKPILYFAGAWLANNIVSAGMKKYGLTKDSPVIGGLVWVMRKIALDVHPPDSVVVQNAATVLSNSPAVVASTGASPDKVSAAADALKKGP